MFLLSGPSNASTVLDNRTVRRVIIHKLHYLPLKYIPAMLMMFRNAREGDKGEECTGSVREMREKKRGVTGFQEETRRHRGRKGLVMNVVTITC